MGVRRLPFLWTVSRYGFCQKESKWGLSEEIFRGRWPPRWTDERGSGSCQDRCVALVREVAV